MASRVQRLQKFLEVQRQMKDLHETRRDAHLGAAVRAEQDASDIARRFDAAGTMATLFPDIYHRHAEAALRLAADQRLAAQAEADKVTAAALREKRIGEAHREAAGWEERRREERQQLETITYRLPRRP